ncbi:MAG: alpha/beta-type small acid-soluble spore protein [Lachnospiraceae bacterium]|nr:alpha/beta-type small acid-soluble spore protein [Lachnospiraceae bacterium]
MASNSGSNTSKMAVPQAKEAMNRFKQEVASEIGVPLKEGYNGDLTSAQAGSIGGEMVKKMIMKQEQQMSGGQQ